MHCSGQVEPQSYVEPQSFYGEPQTSVELPGTSVFIRSVGGEGRDDVVVVWMSAPQPWQGY